VDGMRDLARQSGWVPAQLWTDKAQLFAVHALLSV
jgi:hypothetical protein